MDSIRDLAIEVAGLTIHLQRLGIVDDDFTEGVLACTMRITSLAVNLQGGSTLQSDDAQHAMDGLRFFSSNLLKYAFSQDIPIEPVNLDYRQEVKPLAMMLAKITEMNGDYTGSTAEAIDRAKNNYETWEKDDYGRRKEAENETG